LFRSTLSWFLKNPAYAQADLDLYEFFKGQGANVVNEAADFAGTNGCYLYKGRDVETHKKVSLKDQILVIAPHEGLVSSDVWLACRKKLLSNPAFPSGRKAKNTWLAGKIKCGRCGTSLSFNATAGDIHYFRCRRRADNGKCEGCGTLQTHKVEDSVYSQMVERLREFQTVTGGNYTKTNPKLTALNVELAKVDAEIGNIIDNLTSANTVTMSYVNDKMVELDAKRQSLLKAIADMTAEAVSPEKLERISGYLQDWDNTSFEERQYVADGLIYSVKATSEKLSVEWKF